MVVGCSDGGAVAQSTKLRIASPDVQETDLSTLSAGNQQFSFDLYQALRQNEGNLFFSPYSISMIMSMIYAGARGNKESQIRETMNFSLSQNELHPAFNALDQTLIQRGKGVLGKDGRKFRLNIINAIWGQEGTEFSNEYLNTLALNYGTGIRLLDFVNDPEGSRNTINKWISERIENRFQNLVQPGVINELTRMILTNAIYFKAAWQHPFKNSMTQHRRFNLLNGDSVNVLMMGQKEEYRYRSGYRYQAIELPYSGRELSMVTVLPELEAFETFEVDLEASLIDEIIDELEYQEVVLRMPKFEFDTNYNMAKVLESMGMSEAFSSSADFSGMGTNQPLFINDLAHKAFVIVDESGTEAGAATWGAVEASLPLMMEVDHLFIFLIRDIETDTILFLGRVVDPR
jgi:serpin B